MFESLSRFHTERSADVLIAAGTFVGALLGVSTVWVSESGTIVLGALALTVGFAASLLNPPLVGVLAAGTSAVLGALVSGLIVDFSWTGAALSVVLGLIYTFCLIAPVLVVASLRGRQAYLHRGWELARVEAREQDLRVEQAVQRERDRMAGEIHDGLGHRLTLIAVETARLSMQEGLPDAARAQLANIRANAADASAELGETVRLLDRSSSDLTASLNGLSIEEVIERARNSGLQVLSSIADNFEDRTNDHCRAAVLRGLQEGLTNVAKHAPDESLTVDVTVVADEAVLVMANQTTTTASVRPELGHGLLALSHRAQLLGGSVGIDAGEKFITTMKVPRNGSPFAAGVGPEPTSTEAVVAEAAASTSERRRMAKLAWLVPSALLATAAVCAGGYFVYANIASVLPPERFAAIDVGDTQDEVRKRLPPVEVLDAPRSARPTPQDATCEFYEASISFFSRDDIYRICFADQRVAVADEIPAP